MSFDILFFGWVYLTFETYAWSSTRSIHELMDRNDFHRTDEDTRIDNSVVLAQRRLTSEMSEVHNFQHFAPVETQVFSNQEKLKVSFETTKQRLHVIQFLRSQEKGSLGKFLSVPSLITSKVNINILPKTIPPIRFAESLGNESGELESAEAHFSTPSKESNPSVDVHKGTEYQVFVENDSIRQYSSFNDHFSDDVAKITRSGEVAENKSQTLRDKLSYLHPGIQFRSKTSDGQVRKFYVFGSTVQIEVPYPQVLKVTNMSNDMSKLKPLSKNRADEHSFQKLQIRDNSSGGRFLRRVQSILAWPWPWGKSRSKGLSPSDVHPTTFHVHKAITSGSGSKSSSLNSLERGLAAGRGERGSGSESSTHLSGASDHLREEYNLDPDSAPYSRGISKYAMSELGSYTYQDYVEPVDLEEVSSKLNEHQLREREQATRKRSTDLDIKRGDASSGGRKRRGIFKSGSSSSLKSGSSHSSGGSTTSEARSSKKKQKKDSPK